MPLQSAIPDRPSQRCMRSPAKGTEQLGTPYEALLRLIHVGRPGAHKIETYCHMYITELDRFLPEMDR